MVGGAKVFLMEEQKWNEEKLGEIFHKEVVKIIKYKPILMGITLRSVVLEGNQWW